MTMRRLRDPRLIPLVFGPVIGALGVLETRLDPGLGAAATATWVSGLVLAARSPTSSPRWPLSTPSWEVWTG
ncbi:hypothetical protein, partial [Nonomuraea sp. NPDC050691]|uniref:hypothetical protein n=1 Tax=Nonomuraea sp. NPDC050691 TaxID=3155661 RepID=UPI0033CA859C